jgi:DNA polymerase-1
LKLKYLPLPSEYHKYWYIDLETEVVPDFRPKVIWMMCASRMDQDEVHHFVGHDAIKTFFDELEEEVYFVGHNAVSFDGPVVSRVLGPNVCSSNTVDTLVLSYLYDPGMPNGHSLDAWGERLKDPKGDFHDFSKYSPEMAKYCEQDVRLGKKVTKALWTRMLRTGYSELSCKIEHEVREVIDEQQYNGWYFDIPGAQSLVGRLRAEQEALEGPIKELFPPRLEVVKTYERRHKKDGGELASYLRHLDEYPKLRDNGDGTYSTFQWKEFNIGSPPQRLSRLLELGYEPVEFTPKTEKGGGGNPKVDEESLLAFAELSGRPEVKAIAEWLVLQGRTTMIEGWLNTVNYEDSCIHGRVFTCGAGSRRMTHRIPNTANIPKAEDHVKYGKESRSLWRARPDRVELGFDVKGLQNCMLAEYLGSEAAIKMFTEGDSHLNVTRAIGFPDEKRSTVKNGWYAMIFGAYDPKLGRTFDPSLQGKAAKDFGAKARALLWNTVPGLDQLMKKIAAEFKATGGLLKTFDGGFVRCPSEHSALNYLLQSAEAIVMKVVFVLINQKIKELGIDAMQVGAIHDEGQYDVHPKDVERLGKVCIESIAEAGKILGFVTPLTGDFKYGPNWASTH